jgi:hypothetical protein
VADAHVARAAGADPQDAAPVKGHHFGPATSSPDTALHIDVDD